MLLHYLKVAFKNLLRHPWFSFINVFGLALGMTVCLLSILQIKDAFSYDTFHPHPQRMFRLLTDVTRQGAEKVTFASSPLPLGETLKREYNFVENVVRVYPAILGEMRTGQQSLSVRGAFVDPAFFDVFGFQLAGGQRTLAPYTLVLTAETAYRFFGKANPIGKTVTLEKLGLFTITGVLQPPPGKSHLQFEVLASMATVAVLEQNHRLPAALTRWENYQAAYTYVLLKEGIAADGLRQALPQIAQRTRKTFPFLTDKAYSFRTQPFSRISPGREVLLNLTGEPIVRNLVQMGLIALCVLILAIFNYINLTLARSLSRSCEVGVRKVMGAQRHQLIVQFMVESVLGMMLALGLAFELFQLIKPMNVVQRLSGGIHWDVGLWMVCLGFSLLVGILAGIVPARVLSAYPVVQALKGQTKVPLVKRLSLRELLTVAQFAASLVAIVLVLVLFQQFTYMATATYGFRQEHILNVALQGQSYQRLGQAFAQQAGVEQVSASSALLGTRAKGQSIWGKRPASSSAKESVMAYSYSVDTNFVSNFELTLLAGENLTASRTDSSGRRVLINEEAVRVLQLGTPQEAIGKVFWLNDSTQVAVAGVLKDFRFHSFLFPIAPLLLSYQPQQFAYLNVRVTPGAAGQLVPILEKTWKGVTSYQPFVAEWFDQQLYKQNFQAEDQLFLAMLTAIAITIACLGLLGIVMYSSQTRLKEVGIRKVMGASIGQLIWLLSRDFVGLLLIAGAIGLPVGYGLSRMFLQQYAYHIHIGWGTLLASFTLLLLLGGLAIGSQTVKAALSNPVKSLKNE